MTDQVPPTPEPAAGSVPPLTPQYAPPAGPPAKKGLAITALVLGIVAILGAWIPFVGLGSVFIGVIGLIFGVIATILALTNKAAGKAMAIVGASLSLLAIIVGIVSTAAGVKAVDSALDDVVVSTSTPASAAPEATDGENPSEPTDPAEAEEGETVEEAPGATLDNPGTIGDGTVWTFKDGGDEWQVTYDEVQIVDGFDGKVVVVTGTAIPTVVEGGELSNWISFPSIGWMADGATVDDSFDIVKGDEFDDYRHTVDLAAVAGTEMKFYSSTGLPDGVVPDLMSATVLFGDTFYFSTGL